MQDQLDNLYAHVQQIIRSVPGKWKPDGCPYDDLRQIVNWMRLQQPVLRQIPKPNLGLDQPHAYKVAAVQKYIGQMHYNHLGQPFHTIKKTSSVRSLMQKAQEMIRDALPIKCLEAVVIAMFLTMKMDIDRITVSFKSNVNGNVYRHIVLAIRLGDRWGAIGLSRKADLMNKDLIYPNLSSLIADYQKAYEKNGHTLERIKMGLPLTHNPTSNELVPWKELVIPMDDQAWREIEQHARRCKTLA